MCFEWIHTSPTPGKMVSQSTVGQDSPVDPWEGISNHPDIIDGSPRLVNTDHPPCQLDVRLMRHKASWISPQDVQKQLQDLQPQVPGEGKSGAHFVMDAASPSGPSPLCLGDSLAETTLSEDTTDSTGSTSPHGSSEKRSSFSLSSTEGQVVLPGRSDQVSLLTSPRILDTSPYPEIDSDLFDPSHLTSSADEGAVQGSRTISLNSFSPEVFVLPVDVEKENSHFYVADMIISAMEKMKCNILSQQQTESWSKEEALGLLGSDQPDSEVTFDTNIKQESGSSISSYSGYEGCAVLQVSPVTETRTYRDVAKEICKCDVDEFVVLELGEFNDITETCSCSCSFSKSVTYEPDFNSAELLARELYRVFRKCWILSVVNSQLAGSLTAAGSIVVNEERVQKDFESSMNIVQEIKFKSRIRGTEDWAPPRFQIIFNIHPPLKRDLVVAAQNFFCAGCGTPIEPKFVKRLRYCEYLGKYFCDCCHSYEESCIPARILMMWDFRKYYVSNFSKRLLDSIWHQPIFNLLSIGQSLYTKAKELDRVKEIQEQLFHIKKLLKTCRFADSALKEFEQVPGHLADELHLFSLEDLVRIKKGLLAPLLKDILKACLAHVAGCELCQGKGFICEFCRNTTVIFPFQTETCRRCSVCRACFHKQCFRSSECPRCARITARRKLLESVPSAAT
ncbi:protein associated with UVRAG as autophagy enhancer isoform X1 [Sapajus apella]|uniref:Protein associated with UVRAG as autophagy enhancer isoform X1 n=1 Tax=Sapajus apella TaxID=9515 RepID=A0A6J3J8X6_SAPAP|nr:protein associated with UVRAG as autophagy enhancer isoform X1 [Sapajus apella]XP_032150586.1 protein associated with UVRAG as autophagy enhancer isoform X1 [Sapajus apella]XP_032150587.1 protein associated with UVRAG as autophagy enhancer isoform X1 [Sapajus apella]XP_032150589.1 protein associated with UVRAG as autophagy enhancer isoform X1 [Sapajus apella]